MKKIFLPFLFSAILFTGCSGTPKPVQKVPEILSTEDIESSLKDKGWETQSTTASSFHLWEQLNPKSLLLAENRNNEVLIIGDFGSEEDAEKAFESLIPNGKDETEDQSSDTYSQALVSLPDQKTWWLFRQIGPHVFGASMTSEKDASSFDSIFTSFQKGSSSSTQTPITGTDQAPSEAGKTDTSIEDEPTEDQNQNEQKTDRSLDSQNTQSESDTE